MDVDMAGHLSFTNRNNVCECDKPIRLLQRDNDYHIQPTQLYTHYETNNAKGVVWLVAIYMSEKAARGCHITSL